MGKFVQIIEFKTSKIDELKALRDQMIEQRQAAGDSGGPLRGVMTEDRDRPGYYINIVEFDSYDDAMNNSNHPATQEFAGKVVALCDSAPKFYNLDVRDSFER